MSEKIKVIFTVFEKLQTTTKESGKIQLLSKIKDYPEAKWIFQVVLSKEIKTYISRDILLKIPCGNKQIATFKEFQDLVDKLSHRKITGNKKLEHVRYFFQRCDKFYSKWYKRILAKDLRINVGKATAMKVFGFKEKDFGIKFKPMLAMELASVANLDKLLQKHKVWGVEVKIDGLRCITIFDKGTFECFSRNSKRLYGAEKILIKGLSDELIQKLQGYILDGEFYAKNWSDTMSSIMRKTEIPSRIKLENIHYYVFDILPMKHLQNKVCKIAYVKRKRLLHGICGKLGHPFTFVDFRVLHDPVIDNATKAANEAIKDGWEGVVIKAMESFYECKRSKFWLKVKQFKSLDLLCTGIVPSNKRHEISAITFRYKGKQCRCGSGFSQEQRKIFLQRPEEIVGKIVEIKYQEISKDGCLRFPVFIRVRFDKDKPDA